MEISLKISSELELSLNLIDNLIIFLSFLWSTVVHSGGGGEKKMKRWLKQMIALLMPNIESWHSIRIKDAT